MLTMSRDDGVGTPADTGRHQVQRRAEKKRARSFNELLEVGNFLEEDLAAVVDDGYGWWSK